MWSPPHLPHHPHWPGHNQVRRQNIRLPLSDIRRIWCHHGHCFDFIPVLWIRQIIFQEGPAGGDDVGVVQMEEEEEEEEEREDEDPVGDNGGGEGQQEEVREQADQAE